ncbi:MAG: peptidoglycan editing factor PgeF [Alphaproteobacteria bacterium]|nr:peptidoglycan editing factor PgeF [Alphaproteobacteria bacterium]
MTDDVLFADNLKLLSGASHAFFTRDWGDSWFSDGSKLREALQARERVAAYLGVAPERFLGCHQVHSPKVITVNALWHMEKAPQADALVTDKPGIALSILTADCVPVLFVDDSARVIGAAHAGWRGALGGVLANTVAAMEKLGAGRGAIHAALGPCISQKSYEVGADFLPLFIAEDPANENFFAPSAKKAHYQFDLPGYVIKKLGDLGLGSVQASPADTCADPQRFFSYRWSTLRSETCRGRLVSAVMLR